MDVGNRTIVLADFTQVIFPSLCARGFSTRELVTVEQVEEADYVIVDMQRLPVHFSCLGKKVFCLHATAASLEDFVARYQPAQAMGFVDYSSGLEFIYFWLVQLLQGSGTKDGLLQELFPHQYGRGSACLGLVNSLPLWSASLLPAELPVIITRILPYSIKQGEGLELWQGRERYHLRLEHCFALKAPQLQPTQRIFWLENVKVR